MNYSKLAACVKLRISRQLWLSDRAQSKPQQKYRLRISRQLWLSDRAQSKPQQKYRLRISRQLWLSDRAQSKPQQKYRLRISRQLWLSDRAQSKPQQKYRQVSFGSDLLVYWQKLMIGNENCALPLYSLNKPFYHTNGLFTLYATHKIYIHVITKIL